MKTTDIIVVARFIDEPEWWKITATSDGRETWSVIRKPDRTFWNVVGINVFPLKIDLGEQIFDEKAVALFESYIQGQQ